MLLHIYFIKATVIIIIIEPLSVERCQNLIEKYFFNQNSAGKSSFRFVEIFVNVLAYLLL